MKIAYICLLKIIFTCELIFAGENHSFEVVWDDICPFYKEIAAHPFIREMQSGELPYEKYLHYLQQDVFYLMHDAQAFRLTSEGSPSEFEKKYLEGIAVSEERKILELYVKHMEGADNLKLLHECEIYANHLLEAANTQNYYYAAGSLMPCVVTYTFIANELFDQVDPTNIYFSWFKENKEISLLGAKEYINYILQRATEQEYQDFLKGFRISMLMESLFWEGNYNP